MESLYVFPRAAPPDPTSTERIRDAALQQFAAHGVTATSLRMVAKTAGMSVGALQHHFRTKTGLVSVVDEYVLRVIGETLEPAPLSTIEGDALIEIGNRVTNLVTEYPDVIDYLSHALVEGGEIGSVVFDGLFQISSKQRDQFTEQGLTPDDLDPLWAALNPLILRIGAVILRAHIDRHLPEPLTSPAQVRRWDDAVTALLRKGQMRET